MPQLAGQVVLLLTLAAFIGIAGVLFIAVSAREWAVWFLLKQQGKRNQAKLITLYVLRHRTPDYYVMFQPTADTEIYVTQLISRKTYQHLHTQDTVEILYLPSCRSIARLTGSHVDNRGIASVTIAAFAFVLVSPLFLVVWLVCFTVALIIPRLIAETSLQRLYSWEFPKKQKRKR